MGCFLQRLLYVVLIAVFFVSLSFPAPANATSFCGEGNSQANSFFHIGDEDTGECEGLIALPVNVCTPSSSFSNRLDRLVINSGTGQICSFDNNVAVPTSVSCPGATIINNGSAVVSIHLTAGASCLLSATTTIDGNIVSYTGQIGVDSLATAQISGGGFDTPPLPEISVIGGQSNQNIINGDTTPSIIDGTDFGAAPISGSPVRINFTILNNGPGLLVLNNGSPISISGAHPSDFVIVQQSSIFGDGSQGILGIEFRPTAVGLRTAVVSFPTNDADENPFSFAISGTGTPIGSDPPEISLDLSGLPTTAYVGVPYNGSVRCIASATAIGNIIGANCTAISLPLGLSLGSCTPMPPVNELTPSAAITCPVTGTPTMAGPVNTIIFTSAINDSDTSNNFILANFTIEPAPSAPSISIISPDTGPIAGGTVVTITGTNFIGVTAVSFGGNNAVNFTVISPTEITATTPLGLAGGVDVSVTNVTGSDTATDGFTYIALDTIRPTVTIEAPSETRDPFTATFTFSEDVTGFEGSDILVSNATMSNFNSISALEYTVLITPIVHGKVTINVQDSVAQDLAGNENVAADQVTTNFIDENFVRTRTQRVISNFMGRRADQITANDPQLVNRLQNRGSEGETGQFAGFTAEGTLTNNKLDFSTSLRQMMIAKEQEKSELRKGLGDMMSLGTQNLTQNIDPNGWDLWIKGSWSQSESDTATNDLGLLYLGIDYRLSPTLLVGFLTQFDWSDETDNVENVSVKGQGWMTGPYVVARLHNHLLFDGRAAWGQSENDVNPFGTYTDQFDTTRWLLRGQLTGDFQAGNWHLAPHIGVIYFEEEQEAYTDSLNIFIPSQTISLGRLTFGPKISTRIKVPDGTIISPHLSLKGIWDFDKAELVDLDTGLAAGSSEELRARLEGGLSVLMSNGWSLNGEGFYDGIGVDDLEAYGGSLKLTVPLN